MNLNMTKHGKIYFFRWINLLKIEKVEHKEQKWLQKENLSQSSFKKSLVFSSTLLKTAIVFAIISAGQETIFSRFQTYH